MEMSKLDTLKAQEKELLDRMNQIQADLIVEMGALDQSAYRARLAESGLLKEWNTLQAEIKQLTPRPKKSINQVRKEAGLSYWKKRR